MDDALVGAATERKIGVTELCNERTVHQGVYVRKNLAQTHIGLDLLLHESCVAPYVLAGLLLYAAGKFREGLDLIERVASREGHVRKLIGLDDIQNVLDIHLASPLEVP